MSSRKKTTAMNPSAVLAAKARRKTRTRDGELTILFYVEDYPKEPWVAHCLEHNVVAMGKSPQAAYDLLCELLTMHLRNISKPNAAPSRPASDSYWKLAESAASMPGGKRGHCLLLGVNVEER